MEITTSDRSLSSDEIVQLYITDVQGSTRTPLYSLKDFKRISLKPGESTTVKFTITPSMMMLVNNKGESVLEPGEFKINVGGSLPGKRSAELGASQGAEGVFVVK